MQTVTLPSGERVPAFGLGTWQIGERAALRHEELATIRLALDRGATLIDTAEMYGEGRSETLVGEAIRGRRDEVFLVSKVYPHNATREGTAAACERSLRRLGTDRLDLYLLHWRGEVPLAETLEGFLALQRAGKIRYFGVSNFDLADMQELWRLPGAHALATNQLLYNLQRRGIERELLPWLRERHIPVMAYSPIERSELLRNKKLLKFARRHAMTAAQAALAWLLAQDDIIVIPKTGSRARLEENLGALAHRLNAEQLAEIEKSFPAPATARALEML
jgi:diketogulonate reductase-like aldo/keto reductase